MPTQKPGRVAKRGALRRVMMRKSSLQEVSWIGSSSMKPG